MANADNPADPFKKALAEATKTLANVPELNVTYTVDPCWRIGRQHALAAGYPANDSAGSAAGAWYG